MYTRLVRKFGLGYTCRDHCFHCWCRRQGESGKCAIVFNMHHDLKLEHLRARTIYHILYTLHSYTILTLHSVI